jgi:predicted nucleic acid-binding protein
VNSYGKIVMPDEVLVDSSVIAAIFFKEAASSRAERALKDCTLLTVDLALAEVANVAWKRVVLFNESEEVALKALRKSLEFIRTVCEVISSGELLEPAFKLAIADRIPIYDSLFITAAERENVPLLTRDEKLYELEKSKRNVRLV